ncbi:aminotransferase class I/II-fold pyridoxal phosphate-dependent enzyme [Oceanobacillus sp. 143]|uniref:GntR family transcriptional regulator n=1 Tax=Oceanobacillus zhaokaii TaxID=2052660 RepID=A0A345PEB8_9BACI|nr:PLP-dependent aminotransferase family protein [Oceanobacillus zhaokaii]AXI08348.1 GntR family transcriptional regulator [Oceanobacillus zhaokaii]QGS68255.1 aminotransferase class I/II-fold pyridoxal phosphate-dependent enzyme [Oceanobacillus sp. 143]
MEMLACNLNRKSDVPLYEQLYGYIKHEITEGRLAYNSKLPSKRRLSEYLKISQNTVETAYDQLIAEGYIEGVARKGYFVLAYEDLQYVKTVDASSNHLYENEEAFVYNFHPSRIDTENFPFAKWRKYAKNAIDMEHHRLLLLGDMQGEYELRQEIANYLYHARGVRCTPDEIIIGAGIEILLQQLVLLLGNETIYGVEDPGYHVISQILESHPNKVFPLAVDGEGVKVEQIEKSAINIVYATPSHHFPYGSVLSVNRRVKLLNWALGADNRYIIEDDYDSEFRYSGKTIPSLQSMDQAEKVIYLGSFSKSLIPSLRISYMVLPNRLLQSYKEKLSYINCSVSRIDQHILATFMKQGDFERHLNRMRKIYRRKLDRTVDLLKPYQEKVSVIGGQSGLHIVFVVRNGMTEQELVEKAAAAKIKIYPLSSYSIEKKVENPPKIILGFAGIPEEELELAINLLLENWGILNH